MYGQLLIYKKPNGELLYRATTNNDLRDIGYTNSYGWVIVGKQKMVKGRFVSQKDYDTLLRKKRKWSSVSRCIMDFIRKIDPFELIKWGFVCYITIQFVNH